MKMYINKLMVKASLVVVLMSTVGSLSIQAMEEEDRGAPARAATPVERREEPIPVIAAAEAPHNPLGFVSRIDNLELEMQKMRQLTEGALAEELRSLRDRVRILELDLQTVSSQFSYQQQQLFNVGGTPRKKK